MVRTRYEAERRIHGRLRQPEGFFVVHGHFAVPKALQNVHELQSLTSSAAYGLLQKHWGAGRQ